MRLASINLISVLLCVFLAMPSVQAGPLLYALCQIGCNVLAVSCYTVAGLTFVSVIATAATPAVIVGCTLSFGTCSSACATVGLFAPTP